VRPVDAAAVGLIRRDRLGLIVGLVAVMAVSVAEAALPARALPVPAVVVGPLAACAISGVATVAVVGLASVIAALALIDSGNYVGTAAWSRVVVVGGAALMCVLVAFIRSSRERELERVGRAQGLSLALQRQLLPTLRTTDRVEVRAVYRPGTRDLVVAGDFIDVVPFAAAGAGAVAFCVGDVTGHDPAAAGIAASLRAAWRTLALAGGDPAQWLAALDEFVRAEAIDERLATACVGVLDPQSRRLLVATAGHPRPVLIDTRAVTIDVAIGPPLGLPTEFASTWETDAVGLDPQFTLVLYTDGLVEGRRAPGSNLRYGEESLTAWLDGTLPDALDDSHLEQLVRDVEAANGGPLPDDATLVVLAAPPTVILPADAPMQADPHRWSGPQTHPD
jgi:serine phosphatase RsbU (regulator of sigma subunit)